MTCNHTSSAVHSWFDVFTVILYLRKCGLVASRLGGESVPTASIPGSATQFMSLGQESHHLTLIFMWVYIHKYEWCTAISLLCSVLFMSVPLPYLTEMSCRQMLYSAIDSWGASRSCRVWALIFVCLFVSVFKWPFSEWLIAVPFTMGTSAHGIHGIKHGSHCKCQATCGFGVQFYLLYLRGNNSLTKVQSAAKAWEKCSTNICQMNLVLD